MSQQQPVDPLGPKVVPHDFDLERAMLGQLLLREDTLDVARDSGLVADDFTEADHRALFDEIVRRVERGEHAGVIALRAWADENLKASGGFQLLPALMRSSIEITSLEAALRRLRRLRQQRAMLVVSEGLRLAAFDSGDIAEAVQRLGAELDASMAYETRGPRPFSVIATQALVHIEAAYQRDDELLGLSTGFPSLDWRLGGLARSDLIILAGRPSMGKTSLAMNIATNVAKAGKTTFLISLEMSGEQTVTRVIGDQADIAPSDLLRGSINAQQFENVMKAVEDLGDLPLELDDNAMLTVPQMRLRARQVKRKRGGLDLIVIDYLQLIGGDMSENRTQQLSAITRALKMLAKELDVPVLALSQLSRDVEKRTDKRPHLSDLRDSGSIEQDADVVMFLFREEYYLQRGNDADKAKALDVAGQADVIVAKNRSGPIGTTKLKFEGRTMRFTDIGGEQ